MVFVKPDQGRILDCQYRAVRGAPVVHVRDHLDDDRVVVADGQLRNQGVNLAGTLHPVMEYIGPGGPELLGLKRGGGRETQDNQGHGATPQPSLRHPTPRAGQTEIADFGGAQCGSRRLLAIFEVLHSTFRGYDLGLSYAFAYERQSGKTRRKRLGRSKSPGLARGVAFARFATGNEQLEP